MPVTDLLPTAPLWAWAADAIEERATEMLRHIEGVRLGEDIEAVHDMRVWSRRLVAALRVFAPCFPGRRYRLRLSQARAVTDALGGVRDLDVLLDHYRRLQRELTGEEALAAGYLILSLSRQRTVARRAMLKAMASLEKDRICQRLHREIALEARARSRRRAHIPACRLGDLEVSGSIPFATAAPLLLDGRLAQYYSYEDIVEDATATEQLHALRIKAKWLRYTMELFVPAFDDGLKAELAGAKAIQEKLGELHDSDVRIGLLEACAARRLATGLVERLGLSSGRPIRTGLALAVSRERVVRAGCYEAFITEWRRLEGDGALRRLQATTRAAVGAERARS